MHRLIVCVLLVLGVTATQPLKPPLAKAYDFIVVGGGTAGAVVANRLSEIKDWSVLLLEAGGDEGLILQVPLVATTTMPTGFDWGYRAESTPNACRGIRDKRCPLPKGKVLGGSSAINYMVYTRGNRRDYDSWEAAGNPGWGYKDVLPYFLKSEDQRNLVYAESPYHAVGGPLTVNTPNYHTPGSYAFLQSVTNLGYPVRDYNGANQFGFHFIQAMTRQGRRCSTNKAFLSRSVRRRPNLTISTRSIVTRLLMEQHRVIGVEVLRDGKKNHIRSRREVILCAGSLNDPQILMLSGIGPRHHLQELNIPVVKNLSVGYNLQDHAGMSGVYFTINKSIASLTSDEANDLEVVEQWLTGKEGLLSIPGGAEALGFVSTRLNNVGPEWPDLEIIFASSPIQAAGWRMDNPNEAFDAIDIPLQEQPGFTILPYGVRPKSRGVVRLRTKDHNDRPLIYPNYFSDRQDVEVALEGIKLALKIAETTIFKKLDAHFNNTWVPGCEGLPFGSDAYWECRLRMETFNVHHQVGTCKMGPSSDPDAVVDHRLQVHGIRGLRVMDASIMPTIPSGHTASVVIMIGERGADIIKQEWGVLQ